MATEDGEAPHASRTLVVLNSEWTRLRRTGLSELSRIPAAIRDTHGTSRWKDAYLIVPEYSALHCSSLARQRETILKPQAGIKLVPIACDPGIMPEGDYARIHGDLPTDHGLWTSFAESAAETIRKICPDGYVDILAIDWPMAPILDQFGREARKCFTVDLPPRAGGMNLWKQGLSRADVVHVPTQDWLDYLSRRFPEVEAVRRKCRCIPFGMKPTVDSVTEDKKHEKKEAVQKLRNLKVDEHAMLIVARNRWTHDDQKNHEALVTTLPGVIQQCDENGWRTQFVIGPLGKVGLGSSRDVERQLKIISAQFPEQVFYEAVAQIAECPWDELLMAADAQLLPSRYEPCGIAHAQGMRRGVLPICAQVGAMAEAPVDSTNSFRFERDAEKATDRFRNTLLDAITAFFTDNARYRRMQKSAQQAATFYEWDYLAPRYTELFE